MAHPHPTTSFRPYEQGKIRLEYDENCVPENARDELITLPDVLQKVSGFQSRSQGRTSVWKWNPEWLDTAVFVRQYVHGGILRKLWGGMFLTDQSMQRELRIGTYAWDMGLPTCRPVALWIERFMGIVRRAYYVTKAIPGAVNLLTFCRDYLQDVSPARRQNLARKMGQVLAGIHEHGIYHSDLNLKNLLVRPAGTSPELAIIDFKKASIEDKITLNDGLENLVRLDRSILKWPASRKHLTLSDRLRVFREYVDERSGGSQDWKKEVSDLRPRHWMHYPGRKNEK